MTLFNKKISALSSLIFIGLVGMAQEVQPVTPENDNLRVVYGVVIIILFGMFSYLFYIDRKVNRLEKKQNKIES